MVRGILTMVMLILFFGWIIVMNVISRNSEDQFTPGESAAWPFSQEEVSANGANEGGDSIYLYSDMWMGVANPGAEVLVCYALMHGKVAVIAEKGKYVLFRYEPPSGDGRSEPGPGLDRCPSGTLAVISKVGFEVYRKAYEDYFGKGVQ